jgi:hypothetical protein
MLEYTIRRVHRIFNKYKTFSVLTYSSGNIGTFRPGFLWWSVVECGGVWWSVVECGGVRSSGVEADRSGYLGRTKGSASLKIQGSASSLAHVIIICNDVTRTCVIQ